MTLSLAADVATSNTGMVLVEENHGYGPGRYELLNSTFVREGKDLSSEKVGEIRAREIFHVSEVAIHGNRVRGRLIEGGWLTLKKLENNKIFARPLPVTVIFSVFKIC